MAEEFLNQLRESENSITPENDQRCIICLDDCGSLSPETGLIERLIRLPCTHLVGSRCIATWLHDNNTCPVCRRELFPAQRPRYEHGLIIIDDSDLIRDLMMDFDEYSDDGGSDQVRFDQSAAIIERSSQQLHLSPVACQLSHVIGRRVLNVDVVRYCSYWAQAAMSVFIASRLVDHPVTLEQYTDAIWEMVASELDIETEAMLIKSSRRLFQILVDKAYFGDYHVMHIAALSIYLASRLRLIHVSCGEIASATGASVGAIRTIYASFYPHRNDLLEHRAVDSVWTDYDFERLLHALPREVPSPIEQ